MIYFPRTRQPLGYAATWANGTVTDIGVLHTGDESFATGINDSGVVIGSDQTSLGDHGFIYSNGTMHDLGLGNKPVGINTNNTMVGTNSNLDGIVWAAGSTTSEALLPKVVNGSDWRSITPTAINSSGQICGIGFVNSKQQSHAFLLTPVVS